MKIVQNGRFLKLSIRVKIASLEKKSHTLHHENRSKRMFFEAIDTRKMAGREKIAYFTSSKSFKKNAF